MFQLNQTVDYIRAVDDQVVEGSGVVKGIGFDPAGRAVLLVHDLTQPEGKTAFNVFFKCVNADELTKQSFKNIVEQVVKHSADANAQIKAIVADANAHIDGLWSSVLGEPEGKDKPSGEAVMAQEQAA